MWKWSIFTTKKGGDHDLNITLYHGVFFIFIIFPFAATHAPPPKYPRAKPTIVVIINGYIATSMNTRAGPTAAFLCYTANAHNIIVWETRKSHARSRRNPVETRMLWYASKKSRRKILLTCTLIRAHTNRLLTHTHTHAHTHACTTRTCIQTRTHTRIQYTGARLNGTCYL